jgi:hypothetical protein
MSIDQLDVIAADRPIEALQGRERAVRPIGEILPLVMARYGIEGLDCHQQSPRESREFDYSI